MIKFTLIIDIIVAVAINIISNLIFWAGGGLFLGIVLSQKRRKLFNFFGIHYSTPIIIYLTSLPSRQNTILDKDGIPSRYQGFVPHGSEFQVIPEITTLFTSNTFQRIPDIFSGLIDGFWLLSQPILEFKLSPIREEEIDKKGCICIGGPKFNLATQYYLRTSNPFIKIVKDENEWCLLISIGRRAGEKFLCVNDYDLAVLLKMKDPETSSTIFVAGGTGSNGTRAAVRYLIMYWRDLYRTYGYAEFGVGLKCFNREKDSLAYKQPEVLIKLPY